MKRESIEEGSNKTEEPIANLTDETITSLTVTHGSIICVFFYTAASCVFAAALGVCIAVQGWFRTVFGFCKKKLNSGNTVTKNRQHSGNLGNTVTTQRHHRQHSNKKVTKTSTHVNISACSIKN